MTSTAQNSNGKAGTSDLSSSASLKPKLSRICVSNQYIFQAQLQAQLNAIETTSTREENFRLLGIQWISDTRQALQLLVYSKTTFCLPLLMIFCRPVRTFCTAATYYHKFRLIHKDSDYHYQDAAAGALLTACKIEDTLKKSKEIICAAHNLKIPPSEHLSPDDSVGWDEIQYNSRPNIFYRFSRAIPRLLLVLSVLCWKLQDLTFEYDTHKNIS